MENDSIIRVTINNNGLTYKATDWESESKYDFVDGYQRIDDFIKNGPLASFVMPQNVLTEIHQYLNNE